VDNRFIFVLDNVDDDDDDAVDERCRCSSSNLKLVDEILASVVDKTRPRNAIPPRRGRYRFENPIAYIRDDVVCIHVPCCNINTREQ
jgi:hypothetical protein